jgi:prevent-host-death family protein
MQIEIHQAKNCLSELIQLANNGEDVVITQNDQPVVRLHAIKQPVKKRQLGALKGLVKSMNEDFDKPLPDFEHYS